jgi:hypothetical protein
MMSPLMPRVLRIGGFTSDMRRHFDSRPIQLPGTDRAFPAKLPTAIAARCLAARVLAF